MTAESRPDTAARPPLRRSRRQRLIAGVCGGLAERLGWRPAVVRILFLLIAALPIFPGIVVYVVLWLVVPLEEPAPLP
jgi:phage shock protein PspC (stress-responsive transcriptional regulator)